jgi:hypothetical protein
MYDVQCHSFRAVLVNDSSCDDNPCERFITALRRTGAGSVTNGLTSRTQVVEARVRDCPVTSKHRVQLFELLHPTDEALYTYVSSAAVAGPVDVCVCFDEPALRRVVSAADRHAAASTSSRPIVVRIVEGEDEVVTENGECVAVLGASGTPDIAAAFAEIVSRVHQRVERDITDKAERDAREAEARHLTSLPQSPLLAYPPGVSDAFKPGHVDSPALTFTILLVGAACTGKSTMLTASIDRFVLPEYEPTTRTDVGTFHVVLPQRLGGRIANVRLIDGPSTAFWPTAHMALVFVDLSQNVANGVDDAMHAVGAVTAPHLKLVFVGSKAGSARGGDADYDADMKAPGAFETSAASLGAAHIVLDARRPQQPLLVGLVHQLAADQLRLADELRTLLRASASRTHATSSYIHLGGV